MKQLPMEDSDFKALGHFLPQIEYFATLSVSDVEKLVRSIQLWSIAPGEYVFKQGSPGDAFFVVYEGTVRVCFKKGFFSRVKVMATLNVGSFFGEMSLLSREPHSASIRAETPVKLFVLLSSAFDLLCAGNPDFKSEVKSIAERRKFQNSRNS